MLNIKEKIDYFKNYLLVKNDNYADFKKEEIYMYFFELYGNKEDLNNFLFLDKKISMEEIEKHVEFLVSKIIMNEHQDGVDNIIHEYSV